LIIVSRSPIDWRWLLKIIDPIVLWYESWINPRRVREIIWRR
jgi:hypothetical protein